MTASAELSFTSAQPPGSVQRSASSLSRTSSNLLGSLPNESGRVQQKIDPRRERSGAQSIDGGKSTCSKPISPVLSAVSSSRTLRRPDETMLPSVSESAGSKCRHKSEIAERWCLARPPDVKLGSEGSRAGQLLHCDVHPGRC